MRPPKLPGAEKFKFWDKSLLADDEDGSRNNASYTVPRGMFIRGHMIRNTCPIIQKSVICDIIDGHHHHHDDDESHSLTSLRVDNCRRKVILPITSRLTAKVLSSTDLPLDLFDIRDYHRLTRLRELSSIKHGHHHHHHNHLHHHHRHHGKGSSSEITCSSSSLLSQPTSNEDHEMDSNLSNISNLSNLSLASTSSSPPISESIIV